MDEEEFFNRILNKIAKNFGYDAASTLELMFIKKDKEIKQLKELCDKYEEEHSTKFNELVFDKRENERLTQGVTLLTNKLIDMTKAKEDYKSRNENAIEILNNSILLLPTEYADEVAKVKRKIRNVLQGVDKE